MKKRSYALYLLIGLCFFLLLLFAFELIVGRFESFTYIIGVAIVAFAILLVTSFIYLRLTPMRLPVDPIAPLVPVVSYVIYFLVTLPKTLAANPSHPLLDPDLAGKYILRNLVLPLMLAYAIFLLFTISPKRKKGRSYFFRKHEERRKRRMYEKERLELLEKHDNGET